MLTLTSVLASNTDAILTENVVEKRVSDPKMVTSTIALAFHTDPTLS